MKTNDYIYLKSKVNELNRINDEISLIEWNKDDGPKFSWRNERFYYKS